MSSATSYYLVPLSPPPPLSPVSFIGDTQENWKERQLAGRGAKSNNSFNTLWFRRSMSASADHHRQGGHGRTPALLDAFGHTSSPLNTPFRLVRRKRLYLRTCGSFKSAEKAWSANSKFTNYESANHKKDWVRKSEIREVLHCGISANHNKFF